MCLSTALGFPCMQVLKRHRVWIRRLRSVPVYLGLCGNAVVGGKKSDRRVCIVTRQNRTVSCSIKGDLDWEYCDSYMTPPLV